jgi:hypothetical protein
MKKFLIFPFLFLGILGYTQSIDKKKEDKRHRKIVLTDSMVEKIQRLNDSITATLPDTGTDNSSNNFSANLDSLIRIQKEQREKEKKQALIRIVIGLAFLALLIVGLRKRKK